MRCPPPPRVCLEVSLPCIAVCACVHGLPAHPSHTGSAQPHTWMRRHTCTHGINMVWLHTVPILLSVIVHVQILTPMAYTRLTRTPLTLHLHSACTHLCRVAYLARRWPLL